NDHPVAARLHTGLSNQMTNVVLWDSLISDMPLRGDGVALIVRTHGGEFVGLIHIPRQRCSIWRRTNGEVAYTCTLENGKQVTRQAADVLHVPNFGFNGLHGVSTLAYAAGTVGIGIAADQYSSDFFNNNSTPNGYLKFNKRVTDDVAKFLLDYWEQRHMGAGKRHRTAIVPDGGEWIATGISPSDAQLIESRRFQVNDIARFFGVPLHLMQEMDKSSSWATGLEQQNLAFILYTLQPYLARIEQELTTKLLSGGLQVRYDAAALLKADAKTRYEAWGLALGGNQMPGWMTINEVRRNESLPPIAGGDELYSPLTKGTDPNAQKTA
ncbi:phage portal protein, partial [Candidatus Thiothrix sp. Deng01]